MKKSPSYLFGIRRTFLLPIMLLLVALIWFGCQAPQNPVDPQEQVTNEQRLDASNPSVAKVMAIQDRYTPDLMSKAGVVGTATGMDEQGNPMVLVLVEEDINAQALAKGATPPIPATLDYVRTQLLVTGKIRALKGGGSGVDHKALQTPPIKLGTSGGWRYDLANGYCCGGTLGSLVQGGGKQYILSNYHVLSADIVSGGNNRVAEIGDPIIQPGLIDVGCNANNAQNVATLSSVNTLPGSNVDAAIAEVISGMVDASGEILAIGTLSSNTVGATIGQKVKKSGRTTGLTRSTIEGLNATVSVAYDNECAGGAAFTKTFTGQILIKNRGSKFLAGGDSGSLMVEDVTSNPRAVGLLFAGSSSIGVANPINEVLGHFNVSMVGN